MGFNSGFKGLSWVLGLDGGGWPYLHHGLFTQKGLRYPWNGRLCEPLPEIQAWFVGIPFVTQSAASTPFFPPPFAPSAFPCLPIDLLHDRIMMTFSIKFLYAFIVYFTPYKYESWSAWDVYHEALREERLGKIHALPHWVHHLPSC